MRPRAAGCIALLLGACRESAPGPDVDAVPRPDVVLITIDTLRADHLGLYGYPRDTSPHLDRFAENAVVFEQAVVQWPKTSPSMASMLTGLYCYENGVRQTRTVLGESFDLLAERLLEAGYTTVATVANPNLDGTFGFAQGFDVYRAIWQPLPPPTVPGVGPASEAQETTRFALQAMDERPGEGNYFLWVHYIDPHTPYRPPEPYRERFVGDEHFDGETRLEQVAPPGRPAYSLDTINRTALLGDERRVGYYVAEYDAEIYTTDEQVDALLDGLRERGLLDQALVVITADHGESLGEHNYYFEHGLFTYDASCRVPLLMKVPGGTESRRIPEVVGLVDLVPTVLDYVGLPADPRLPGRSWRSLVEGGGEASPPFVYTEGGYADEYQRVVRSRRWKLIHVPSDRDRNVMTGQEYELYDIENDPHETVNLQEQEPMVAARLRDMALEFLRESVRGRVDPPKVEPTDLDPTTAERLQALGYVDKHE